MNRKKNEIEIKMCCTFVDEQKKALLKISKNRRHLATKPFLST